LKKIVVDKNCYELIKDYREGFQEGEFIEKCTDYFYDYDYIVGDIAYGKLRLKGFYDKGNKKVKPLNNYEKVEEYLKNDCANDCRHFIVKKVGKTDEV